MNPSVTEILLRLACAAGAGFILGWERESHGRPAGLRTNMLACVASATAMLVSEIVLSQTAATPLATAIRADPARLGAGILTGFGFLGAGTILRHENFVRGVTTAATLWFGAVLGLAFGAGLYLLGFLGLGIAIVTLLLLPLFEKKLPSDWYVNLSVTARLNTFSEDDFISRLRNKDMKVLRMNLKYDLTEGEKTVVCEVKLKRADAVPVSKKLAAEVTAIPGVLRFECS